MFNIGIECNIKSIIISLSTMLNLLNEIVLDFKGQVKDFKGQAKSVKD